MFNAACFFLTEQNLVTIFLSTGFAQANWGFHACATMVTMADFNRGPLIDF